MNKSLGPSAAETEVPAEIARACKQKQVLWLQSERISMDNSVKQSLLHQGGSTNLKNALMVISSMGVQASVLQTQSRQEHYSRQSMLQSSILAHENSLQEHSSANKAAVLSSPI